MAGTVGGLVGMNAGKHAQQDVQGMYKEALGQFQGIRIPTPEEQALSYLLYENQGTYNPLTEAALGLDPSAMENVQIDPRLVDAQMAALAQVSEMGETGMTAAQAAALREARREAAGLAQAKSAQIQSDFARRGMGGSGNELAAQLLNAQASADRASQESDRLSQMAQQNALQALSQQGSLATNIGNQQFSQQSDIAKARDYINQFNKQNQQSVQQRNVAAQNEAQLRNLQQAQQMANANVDLRNQQQKYNKELQQQYFQNQMGRAGNIANAYQGMAGQRAAAGQAEAKGWANVGKGLSNTIMGGVGMMFGKPPSSNPAGQEEQ